MHIHPLEGSYQTVKVNRFEMGLGVVMVAMLMKALRLLPTSRFSGALSGTQRRCLLVEARGQSVLVIERRRGATRFTADAPLFFLRRAIIIIWGIEGIEMLLDWEGRVDMATAWWTARPLAFLGDLAIKRVLDLVLVFWEMYRRRSGRFLAVFWQRGEAHKVFGC